MDQYTYDPIFNVTKYDEERAKKWLSLGQLREERGQYDNAERAYERVLELDPSLFLRLSIHIQELVRRGIIKRLDQVASRTANLLL